MLSLWGCICWRDPIWRCFNTTRLLTKIIFHDKDYSTYILRWLCLMKIQYDATIAGCHQLCVMLTWLPPEWILILRLCSGNGRPLQCRHIGVMTARITGNNTVLFNSSLMITTEKHWSSAFLVPPQRAGNSPEALPYHDIIMLWSFHKAWGISNISKHHVMKPHYACD